MKNMQTCVLPPSNVHWDPIVAAGLSFQPAGAPSDSGYFCAAAMSGSSEACVICASGALRAACIPCGHISLCLECRTCVLQGESQRCVICRLRFTDVVAIRPAGLPSDEVDGDDRVFPYVGERVPPHMPAEDYALASQELAVAATARARGDPAARAAATRVPGWLQQTLSPATSSAAPTSSTLPPATSSAAPTSSTLPTTAESSGAFSDYTTQSALRFKSQAEESGGDIRFYVVWKMPLALLHRHDDFRGIHRAPGLVGYHRILKEAGGFGGGLKWKATRSLDEAVRLYHTYKAVHEAPLHPPFYSWG